MSSPAPTGPPSEVVHEETTTADAVAEQASFQEAESLTLQYPETDPDAHIDAVVVASTATTPPAQDTPVPQVHATPLRIKLPARNNRALKREPSFDSPRDKNSSFYGEDQLPKMSPAPAQMDSENTPPQPTPAPFPVALAPPAVPESPAIPAPPVAPSSPLPDYSTPSPTASPIVTTNSEVTYIPQSPDYSNIAPSPPLPSLAPNVTSTYDAALSPSFSDVSLFPVSEPPTYKRKRVLSQEAQPVASGSGASHPASSPEERPVNRRRTMSPAPATPGAQSIIPPRHRMKTRSAAAREGTQVKAAGLTKTAAVKAAAVPAYPALVQPVLPQLPKLVIPPRPSVAPSTATIPLRSAPAPPTTSVKKVNLLLPGHKRAREADEPEASGSATSAVPPPVVEERPLKRARAAPKPAPAPITPAKTPRRKASAPAPHKPAPAAHRAAPLRAQPVTPTPAPKAASRKRAREDEPQASSSGTTPSPSKRRRGDEAKPTAPKADDARPATAAVAPEDDSPARNTRLQTSRRTKKTTTKKPQKYAKMAA